MAGAFGQAVQAGSVSGGVHFHGPEATRFPGPRQLPGGVRDFVNRSDEIAQLDSCIGTDGSGTVLIAGTAGAGKTALAVHWSHRVKERYPAGQLYANLRGYDPQEPVTVERVIDGFLRALGVPPAAAPAAIEDRTALYRSILAGGGFLVVLDNVSSARQERPLLPGAGCAVVVTTRGRLSGLVARDGARRVEVGTLSAPQSVALLRTITDSARGKDAPAELAHLARLCALLPLALRIAAERAAVRPHMPLADLINELQDGTGPWESLVVDEDEQDTIDAVFAWSYRGLPDDAARLFRVLGLMPGTDFSVPAAAAAADLPVRAAARLLDALAGAHLLEQSGAERFEFHDLLRAYAAELGRRHDAEEIRVAALRRVLDWYLRTAHHAASFIDTQFRTPEWPVLDDAPPLAFADRAAAVEWLEQEKSNLVAAVKRAEAADLPEPAWRLAATLGRIYASRPHIEDWIDTGRVGLSSARERAPAAAVADLLDNLGMALVQAGKGEDALAHHEEALAIRTAEHDLFGQGASHNALGLVRLRAHQMADARTHFEEALTRFRELGDERWEGIALANLADALLETGELAAAESAAHTALCLQRATGNRLGEFSTLITLGRTAQEGGRGEEAREHTIHALRVAEELENSVRIAYASLELGRLHAAEGGVDAALEAFFLAAAMHRDLGEVDREAESLLGAAEVQRSAGRIGEAVELCREAVSSCRRHGARRRLAFALARLGRLLAGSGELSEAGAVLREAHALLDTLGDPEAQRERERVALAIQGIAGR